MKTYSVGEAAKAAHMTSETLRHYDRIGLVRPRKDEWTRYRRYTEQDIVRLHTVSALRVMGLPLREIQKVLAYDELEKIVDFLEQAEKRLMKKSPRCNTARRKSGWPGRTMKRSSGDGQPMTASSSRSFRSA